MSQKIKVVKVTDVPTWGTDIGFPKYRYSVNVWGMLQDGEPALLFTCFRDELPSWVPDELIGLTLNQAKLARFWPPSELRERQARTEIMKEMAAEAEARRLEELINGEPLLPPD